MSLPDPVCNHHHPAVAEFDHGRDPETGYRDCGTTVTCLNCGEIFTESEYRQVLADQERDRNPQPGDVYLQFDTRLVIVDAGGDDVYFTCRDGSYTGPLRSTTLERFQILVSRGLITRVRGSAIK